MGIVVYCTAYAGRLPQGTAYSWSRGHAWGWGGCLAPLPSGTNAPWGGLSLVSQPQASSHSLWHVHVLSIQHAKLTTHNSLNQTIPYCAACLAPLPLHLDPHSHSIGSLLAPSTISEPQTDSYPIESLSLSRDGSRGWWGGRASKSKGKGEPGGAKGKAPALHRRYGPRLTGKACLRYRHAV